MYDPHMFPQQNNSENKLQQQTNNRHIEAMTGIRKLWGATYLMFKLTITNIGPFTLFTEYHYIGHSQTVCVCVCVCVYVRK